MRRWPGRSTSYAPSSARAGAGAEMGATAVGRLGSQVSPTAAGGTRLPVYAFPEDAARALAHAARWAEWRTGAREALWRAAKACADEARALIAAALRRSASWLSPDDVGNLLGCYGIKPVESRL